jgi:hypothetical protein
MNVNVTHHTNPTGRWTHREQQAADVRSAVAWIFRDLATWLARLAHQLDADVPDVETVRRDGHDIGLFVPECGVIG